MKKILIASLVFISLNAKIVDKIVAVVNNNPITSYDVKSIQNQLHINKNQALNILIDKTLINSEIEKRGISVDDYEIDDAMRKIAKRNNMSLFEFQNILTQKGELKEFEKKLKENLLKQKLFSEIVSSKLKIDPKEIKNYYENHKNEFSVFQNIQVVKYASNNPEILKELSHNPYFNNTNLVVTTSTYSYNQLPLDKLYLFKNTKVGQFTPIINSGLNYVRYFISEKKGKVYLPFNQVQNIIAQKMITQKRNEILKEYFDKIKNRADIKIYN